MIISLSLTQTHDGETPKQLMMYHELMIGAVHDHHAHSIYPPPRRFNPEITRRPWRVCSCLTPTASTELLTYPPSMPCSSLSPCHLGRGRARSTCPSNWPLTAYMVLVYHDHNQVNKVLGVHIGVREISRSGKDLLDVGLVR